MIIETINRQYDDGEGVEVIFYYYGFEVGKACTVEYNGKPNSFLHNFYVEEQFRKQGIGTQILRYMIENFNVEILYVDKDNKEAIRLYHRFGFVKTEDLNENMIVMRRSSNNVVYKKM